MEYAAHGDLLNYLRDKAALIQIKSTNENIALNSMTKEERATVLDEALLMSFAWQVAKGMQHLENLKVNEDSLQILSPTSLPLHVLLHTNLTAT